MSSRIEEDSRGQSTEEGQYQGRLDSRCLISCIQVKSAHAVEVVMIVGTVPTASISVVRQII